MVLALVEKFGVVYVSCLACEKYLSLEVSTLFLDLRSFSEGF